MKLLSRLFFAKLDFRQQLILTFSIGIACLAIVSSLVISSISSQTVYDQLLRQGQQITDSFNEQSTLALLYQSPDNAKEAALATLAFPDIAGVAIFTPDRKTLFKSDALNIDQQHINAWPLIKQSYIEDSASWYFWAPVYTGGSTDNTEQEESPFGNEAPLRELVGFVHVVMTKDTLNSMTEQIFRSNLLTSIGFALLLLFFLLAITKRVTQPLKNLAHTMGRAEQGEIGARAELSGPKDVIMMETAFNTMMAELESREQELKRARDTALASAQVKGEFAATVSHELRTPMNGVMGMLELLHGMGLTDKQEEYVKIARTSGEALLVLIDDILDFSKIESGKLKIHSVDINPRNMLEEITELLSTQARQKNLQINAYIENNIPQAIRGDSGRIRQVLINLAGNAIKFTEKGEVTLRLSIQKDNEQQEKLFFEVQDTGIGIPEDAQLRIFEAFAQVDSSTTRKYGGTGLGLAICHQLVELMGGYLGVKSAIGKGSTFWFTIPLEAPLGDGLHDKVDPARMAGLRVLIVGSDAASTQSLVQTFISWESFQRMTSNGLDALNLLSASCAQGKPYDLVVIDTPVEHVTGLELAKKIRANAAIKNTQIIILSETEPFIENEDKILGIWLPKSPPAIRLFKTINHLLLLRSSEIAAQKPLQPKKRPAYAANILVAEDNTANQLVALGMLDRLGHKAQIAIDGQATLNQLNQNTFDIVLMDCLMPGMDGYETTRHIRNHDGPTRHIPIIAMTANVGPNDSQRCFDAGMDDFIAKPLNLDELEKKLDYWIENKPLEHHTDESASDTARPCVEDQLVCTDPNPTLDEQVITKLALKTGQAFAKMLHMFLSDTPGQIDQLSRAVSERDALSIRDVAHSIKGSALNLGARKLAHLCELLEQAGTENMLDNSQEVLDRLYREYRNLQTKLEQRASSQDLQQLPPVELEHQPRVLIVDDDPGARVALNAALEEDGYIIFEADNGVKALALCEKEWPDIVLMDAMMPELDGFSACEQIQQLEIPFIPPVLMITALQDEKSIEKAFVSGATDFIPKPVNLTVLRQRISRLLKTNRAEKHVHQLSYYDSLTNLPNRTLFMERAHELLQNASDKDQKIALMFLDLDRFKLINDTQGHDAGDLLLKTVALRLQGSVRNADLVARLSGDEFTIILDDVQSPEVAAKVAEKICHTLIQPFSFMQQQVYVSTSIGIAIYPQNGSNVGTLMKHADTAMFRAKAKGGGCFQFYEYGMETEISRQVELESELRRALERDELILHFQPQANLTNQKLVGMEALVRWQHPQRGLLPPSEFIPLAEESGLINTLGDWVLLKACEQQKAWVDQGLSPLPVAVNVSGRQLENDVLINKIKEVLEKTGLSHSLLKLEITEDTLAESSAVLVNQLNELKDLGITLAIDDFGTGYSSLSYLKKFPVDTLKIDRSFIKDLPADNESAAIISGIIALGHSLGMNIVAEGVETEEQRQFLQKEGCDIEQGYLLSRPLPTLDLEQWLQSHVT